MSEESKKLAKAIIALKSVDMDIRICAIDAVKADEVEIAVGLSLEDHDPPEFEKWVLSKGSGNTSPLLTCSIVIALFHISIICSSFFVTIAYSFIYYCVFSTHLCRSF